MTRAIIFCVAVACAVSGCKTLWPKETRDAERDYHEKMRASEFADAIDIARESGLERRKLLRAVYARMWSLIKSDMIRLAHSLAEGAGLTSPERHAFGETAFGLYLARRECETAAKIAAAFRLAPRHKDRAAECARQDRGTAYALGLACRYGASPAKRQELERDLGRMIRSGYEYWYRHAEDVVKHCDLDPALADAVFVRLLDDLNDFDLAVVLVRKAKHRERKDVMRGRALALYEKMLEEGSLGPARNLLEERLVPREPEHVARFVKAALPDFACVQALEVAHEARMPDEFIESIFAAPKCSGTDLTSFALVVPSGDLDQNTWYMHMAVTHGKFRLAWRLAERIPDDKTGPAPGAPAKDYVLERAYAAGAHAVVIEFRGVDVRAVFEHALAHGEEWFAATFAEDHAENPEAIVERAYLRAMERGEIMLAVQIAEKYGKAEKLQARARIAFEHAMLAEKPKLAQRILKTGGVEDPDLERRAAVMRFEQRREAMRKKAREKRRRAESERTDDWNVRRE